MRQVASVVKDGKVQYFVADTEEGELTEFATIAVPESWGAQQSIMLGFNLIAAIGLTAMAPGTTAVRTAPTIAAPPRYERGLPAGSSQWSGTPTAITYIRDHPGCRIGDMADHFDVTTKAVASAVTRGAATGDIVRRNGLLYPSAGGGSSIMDTMTRPAMKPGGATSKRGTPRQRAHAGRKQWDVTVGQVAEYIALHPGCGTVELAEALLGSAGKVERQVISNRVQGVVTRAAKGDGPRLDKSYVPNPNGGVDIVQYRFVPRASVEPPVDVDIPTE
jgi:hypothetical protein